jgi:hypothetical protein
MEAATAARAQRAERERRTVAAAAERHEKWLKAQASSTIPNHWHAEARRQADEAARSEERLMAEIRELRRCDRFSPIRPLQQKDGDSIGAPPAVPTAVPQSDRET